MLLTKNDYHAQYMAEGFARVGEGRHWFSSIAYTMVGTISGCYGLIKGQRELTSY